jgi:hypothetical protein
MARIGITSSLSRNSARPLLVLLSRDTQLGKAVKRAAGKEWIVWSRVFDELASLIREPNVRLVVFDDQSVSALDRGWALAEIRRYFSRASIVYIAAQHDSEIEREARVRGVLFYTSKPLRPADASLLLKGVLRMHKGNPHSRIGPANIAMVKSQK